LVRDEKAIVIPAVLTIFAKIIDATIALNTVDLPEVPYPGVGSQTGCQRRRASARRPLPAREFGINESDGAPDEKEGRPKHQPPGYQACMMRGEMWPRRQETLPFPA